MSKLQKINNHKLKAVLLAMGITGGVLLGGSELIAPEEGLVVGTYVDPVGIVTSCIGHTGKDIKLGDKFTEEECYKQFGKDLIKHNSEMMKYVKVDFKSPYQHAAILSFCFNVGTNACGNSTMMKKLNSGNHAAACKEITKWVYAQKKDCRLKENNCSGIVTRRTKEYNWCMEGG